VATTTQQFGKIKVRFGLFGIFLIIFEGFGIAEHFEKFILFWCSDRGYMWGG
jgi:hypothetical protein